MSANISYLTVSVTVGHQTFQLKTDTLPTPSEAQAATTSAIAALKDHFQQGITFRMDPDQSISATPGDFVNWINSIGNTFDFALPDLSAVVPGWSAVATDLTIEVRNLVVSTNRSISFDMRLTLSSDFVTDLGIPAEIGGLFGQSSIGFGFSYTAPAAA